MKKKMYLMLKGIKRLLIKIRRIFVKCYKFFVVKKTISNNKKNEYKIGFLVQLSSIWDKQINIYEELLKRDNIKVFLFVVPEYDFENDIIINSYEGNYFIEKYENAIKVIDENNTLLNLKEYELDYLFYPRPYDHYLPLQYRSGQVSKYCKCCYIPYGLTGSDNFDDTDLPFFDNIHCLFMDSDYQMKLIKKRYPISCKFGVKRVYSLGYPVLARFLDYPKTNGIHTIAWTPRWSMDPVKGGSNFLKYCNNFLELIENDNYNFIFRPHPLMFDELIKKGFIDEKFKNSFLEKLNKYNVLFDTVSPIEEIFKRTDLLITDFSTIISQFFMTNRPLIYCEGGIPLNEDYLDMMKYSYYANDWSEVLKFIDDIEKKGDSYFDSRKMFIDKKYSICRESAKLIADKILD